MTLNLVREIEVISKNVLTQLNPDIGYELIKRLYGLDGSKIFKHGEVEIALPIGKRAIRKIEKQLLDRFSLLLLGREKILFAQVPDHITKEATNLREFFVTKDKIVTLSEAVKSCRRALSIYLC